MREREGRERGHGDKKGQQKDHRKEKLHARSIEGEQGLKEQVDAVNQTSEGEGNREETFNYCSRISLSVTKFYPLTTFRTISSGSILSSLMGVAAAGFLSSGVMGDVGVTEALELRRRDL